MDPDLRRRAYALDSGELYLARGRQWIRRSVDHDSGRPRSLCSALLCSALSSVGRSHHSAHRRNSRDRSGLQRARIERPGGVLPLSVSVCGCPSVCVVCVCVLSSRGPVCTKEWSLSWSILATDFDATVGKAEANAGLPAAQQTQQHTTTTTHETAPTTSEASTRARRAHSGRGRGPLFPSRRCPRARRQTTASKLHTGHKRRAHTLLQHLEGQVLVP